MELFESVFHAMSIYDMIFLNVKSVLEFPTLKALGEAKPEMQARWNYIAETYYSEKASAIINSSVEDIKDIDEEIYKRFAVKYPEFMKIVAISYAKLYPDSTTELGMKRKIYKIAYNDEVKIIEEFMDILHSISSECSNANPPIFDTFCGYNIINYEIPLLIKRFILNRNSIKRKELPLILKKRLVNKPWESGIIDAMNVWKFNGSSTTTLMLISDFLGLKKTIDVLPLDELSEYYWDNVESDPEKMISFVSQQSLTQTNLVIQLMCKLRIM